MVSKLTIALMVQQSRFMTIFPLYTFKNTLGTRLVALDLCITMVCTRSADIPSDPPFAGWARIFHDRPAYPLTVFKNPRSKITHKQLPFVACSTCRLLNNAVWSIVAG